MCVVHGDDASRGRREQLIKPFNWCDSKYFNKEHWLFNRVSFIRTRAFAIDWLTLENLTGQTLLFQVCMKHMLYLLHTYLQGKALCAKHLSKEAHTRQWCFINVLIRYNVYEIPRELSREACNARHVLRVLCRIKRSHRKIVVSNEQYLSFSQTFLSRQITKN